MFDFISVLASPGEQGGFQSKMLESPTSAPSAPAAPSVVADPTTAQHQQMARKIENGDFAEDYFGSLTGPAKRLIEVRLST